MFYDESYKYALVYKITLNVTDYFFSSVHFARGNLNSVLVSLITKPFEFKAKLMGVLTPHKSTSVLFGNLKCVIPESTTPFF